ncbi:MAG TPA: glycoside hydrolase family 99-like domain-containing protein [Burkholderiales bacterium]|nr:glycoside hydrolase family 99-like domain-containing protein [Burkholderiales bacterium]
MSEPAPKRIKFHSYLTQLLHGRHRMHRPFEAKPPIELDCERIAFYLPQFHRCEENDRFWGSGFTEWTNVVRALPKFVGHYQPRLPGDLGFYDLTVEDTLQRQVDIARNYGLTGFMFYFYWFGGKTVLEAPLRTFLRKRSLRFRYFLMWANENWTRRWDGLESEVLLRQTYGADEPERFLHHIREYLEDERYIRVDGRPVIAVYRAGVIPDVRGWVERWREACVRMGLRNPYLISALSFQEGDPGSIGFDAALEFPPHQTGRNRTKNPRRIEHRVQPFFAPPKARIYDYGAVIESQFSIAPHDYRLYRTAFPAWDNSARRRDGKGVVFAFSNPRLFADWTTRLLREEMARTEAFRMICFNAWNEWAEAAYLEPDSFLGYAYLDALYGTLSRFAAR